MMRMNRRTRSVEVIKEIARFIYPLLPEFDGQAARL